MRIARLNLAHGSTAQACTIERIRHARERCGHPVAILADLPGPKLRIGVVDPEPVVLEPGGPVVIITRGHPGGTNRLDTSPPQTTVIDPA